MARSLAALLRNSEPRDGTAIGSVVSDRIALAVSGPSPAGAGGRRIASLNGTTLAICGDVYEPALSHGPGKPEAAALLDRFRAKGVGALEGLNGDYVIAVWEAGARRLTLVNDRFGLRLLYYWAAGRRFAFGPCAHAFPALPGFPTTIDEFALGDFLAVGHHLGERTWYAALRLLPPASVLTLTESGLSLRIYWHFVPTRPAGSLALEDLKTGYAAALRAAVRRRLPASEVPIGIPLDRAMNCAALLEALDGTGARFTSHHNPTAAGCPPGGALRVTAIPMELPPVIDRFVTGAGRLLPSCLPCHSASLAQTADLFRRSRVHLFMAHLGTLFAYRHLSSPSRVELDTHGPASPRRRPIFLDAELRQILRPEVYRIVRGVAADTAARAYANTPRESAAAKALALRLRYQQPHLTPFALEHLTQGCNVAVPYADHDVVEMARRQDPASAVAAPRLTEPHDLLGEIFGGRDDCTHPSWALEPLLDGAAEPLADFFRLPRLRELVRQCPSPDASIPRKLCAIAGIAACFATAGSPAVTWDDLPDPCQRTAAPVVTQEVPQ